MNAAQEWQRSHKFMSRIAWKWLLPALMLALTVGLHFYEPKVYRTVPGWSQPHVRIREEPAWPGRIELGLNYPVVALMHHVDGMSSAVFCRDLGYGMVLIAQVDLIFFAWLMPFWHVVGRKLDRITGRDRKPPWPRWARAGALVVVCLAALWILYRADRRLTSDWRASRHVAAAGVAWGTLLLGCSVWGLARNQAGPRGRAAAMVSGAVAALGAICWVGGPLCAMQAAGDCVRPSVTRFSPYSVCTADGNAPADLRRVIQAEASRRHLTLLRLVVCEGGASIDHPNLKGILRNRLPERDYWVPAGPQAHVYQYRRYVTVFVPGTVNGSFIYVQGDLIQSRWDFLRENWHRIEPAWSWPYIGVEPDAHAPL